MAADLYKRWTLHILYPSRYRRLVKDRAVRDNKVVFLEVRERRLTDSFLPVYRALKKAGNGRFDASFFNRISRTGEPCGR